MSDGQPAGSKQIATGTKAATDLAFVPRGQTKLGMIVRQDVPEIDIKAGQAETSTTPATPPATPPETGTTPPATAETPPATQPAKKEKSGCAVGGQGAGSWLALVVLGLALGTMRRRRSR